MIVLIAPEKDIKGEIEILNQLFEAGLEYYHLRKPNKNYKEYCAYLERIDSNFHNQIVIHQFHELIDAYNLKGIHFQEQTRREQMKNLPGLKRIGKTISSSFHELEELEKCTVEFDYHLLSPVFSSISKEGYEGRGFDVNHINKNIIGMGGVTKNNLDVFTKLGYNGVGVLGGIWNSPTPIEDFKIMLEYFTGNKMSNQ